MLRLYLKRQEIIEHVFGTIKRQRGYDHLLLKGLKKNDGEFGLIFLVYTESDQVYGFYVAVPLGITHSKQSCFRKPAKNEYAYDFFSTIK
ncbi:MAG: hypothetical protein FJY10_02685 [Bacteroidetes bacterium]|nr:hypothetical protein [Bacteroidota bacterium]